MSPRSGPTVTPQVFEIMLSLLREEMHGYALMRDIENRTGGAVRLTASTLYGAIGRMLDAGWIEELDSDVNEDGRRRIYRLTREGRLAARQEAVRLEGQMREARRLNLLSRQGPR